MKIKPKYIRVQFEELLRLREQAQGTWLRIQQLPNIHPMDEKFYGDNCSKLNKMMNKIKKDNEKYNTILDSYDGLESEVLPGGFETNPMGDKSPGINKKCTLKQTKQYFAKRFKEFKP